MPYFFRVTVRDDRSAVPFILRVEAESFAEAMKLAAEEYLRSRGVVDAMTATVEIVREPD